MLAPIILFVYNRPWHTEQTVEALKMNELVSKSDFFIFSDGSKAKNDENVEKVREYIKTIDGFKSVTIIEREKNFGLANSVISGVTDVVNRYGKVIVLEDDVVTSQNFLEFINEALFKYEGAERVYSISGYNVPMDVPVEYKEDVFLTHRYSSQGWGTWKDRWKEADWSVENWEEVFSKKEINNLFRRGGDDLPYILKAQMNGTLNSWAIRWYYSHFRKNRFTIFPIKSLVENIGFDGTGVHCGNAENSLNKPVIIDPKLKIRLPEKIEFNKEINNLFVAHYKYGLKDRLRRFIKESIRYKINKSE